MVVVALLLTGGQQNTQSKVLKRGGKEVNEDGG